MDIEQRIAMLTKIRELRGRGEPEKAADIQEALNAGRFFLGGGTIATDDDAPKVPKKGAKREAWVKYAKLVSDIDHEIVERSSRNDLIGMLKANGLII